MFNTELDQNNQPMKGSAGYFNLDDLGKVPHRPSRPAPVVTPNFPTQAAESVPMDTPENYEYYQSAPLTPNNQAAGDMEYNEQWSGGVVSDAAQFLFRGIGGGLYKALWQGVGQVGALMQSDMLPEMFGSVDKANAQSEYVFGNALTELSDKMVGMAPKVHSASRFDAGYWTEGTGTVFSTLSPYLIGLGTAKGAQALLKMMGVGAKLTAAGATLTSAVAMRHAENYTEAAQVYKNIFDEAIANGDSYDVASQKAGEGAAETYKLDWLNLGFDLFQMASILKPLKVITRNEGVLTGALAKAAGRNNPWFKEIAGRAAKFGALESMSEGVEEMVNEIAQAEGKDGQPMDGNFLQAWGDIIMNRGSKYMSDAKVWDSFIFGTMGGAVAQLGFGALNKESRLKLQSKLIEIAERANDTKELINDYAANQGSDADFYMSKRRSMAKFAMRAVEAGNVDLALEQLDDTEGLAQTLGIDPKELAKSDNLRQELKDQILWTERAYKRYGSHSLFTNSDYYNALRDTSIAMSAQIRANGQALNYVNESTAQLKDDMGFSTLSPIATQYLDITEEAIAIEAKLKSIEPMLRDVNNPEYATYKAFANRLQRRQDQINEELGQINETLKTPQRVDSTNTVEVSNLKELNDSLSRFRSKDLIQAKAFGLDIALDNDLLSEALNTLETKEGVEAFEDEIRTAQREQEKAIDDARRKAKDEKKRKRAEDSRKEAETTPPISTPTTPESTVTPETPQSVVTEPVKGTEEPELKDENANSIILKTPAQTEATNSIIASFSEVRSSVDLRIVDAGSAIAWLHLPYDVVTGPDGNPSLVTDPKQGVNTEIQDHRIYLKEFFGAGTPLTLEVDSTHPHYALALEQEKARGLDGMLVPIAVKSQDGTTVGYLHTIDWIRPFTTVETTPEGGDNIALQRTILRRMREAVIAQGSISAFVSNKSLGHIEFNETRTTVADAIKSPEVSMAIAKDGELYLDRDRKVSSDLLVDKNKLVSGLPYLVVPTNVSGKFAVLPVDTIKLSNSAVETMAKAIEIFCNADEEVHLDLLNASDGEFNLLQASSLRSILERFIYTTNLNEENSAKIEKDKKSDKIYVAVRSNGIDFQRAGYPKLILTRELYGRNKSQFDANLKEFMQQVKNLYFKLNLTDALKESTTFPQYDSATNSWNVTPYKYQDYMRMVTSTKYREESTVVDGKTYYTHFFQPNIHIQLTPGSITATEPVSEKEALEHDLEMLVLKAFGEPGHTVDDLIILADTLRPGEDPEFDQIVAEARLIIDDIKALSTSPGSTLADKIAELERRRQEELDRRSVDRKIKPGFGSGVKVGQKVNDGNKVIVLNSTSNDSYDPAIHGDGYSVYSKIVKDAEFTDGKMSKAAEVEIEIFPDKETADRVLQERYEKLKAKEVAGEGVAIKAINAKYDAELEALKAENAKETAPNVDNIIGDLGLEVSASLDYIEDVELNEVRYVLKSLSILQSNKAVEVFSKGAKNKWSLEKTLTELQIPKEQKELILSLGVNSREEIITNLLANYSYTVEINTAEDDSYKPNPWEKETKEQKRIREKISGIPTQYYSNLTVPGGTNYTENEIATPAITPSIKGHAQFATDKGIGWFRSDVQVANGEFYDWDDYQYDEQGNPIKVSYADTKGEVTKTRRILEVQSDLFQKGRDKEDLTNNIDLRKKNKRLEEDLYGSGFDELLKERNQAIINSKNSSENQFLQLLNKDNNWVTFFVKSIIQDSAKKGYEKVLFPTGNTASKVEGHTTLEEFKKQKEDRIKELEKSKTKEKYNFTDDYGQTHTVKTDLEKIDNEINQLKQELERVEREGFGALKPIYKFYENTVTNVLKKQGYNPKQITDEYGNTWNEVIPNVSIISLSPEDSREYLPKNYLIDPKNFDGYKQNTVVNLMMASVLNWVQQDRTLSVYQAFDRLKTAYSKLAEHPSYKDKFQPILDNFTNFKSLTLDRLEQLEFLDIAKKFNDKERFANDTDSAPDERYDQDAMSIDPKDSVSGRLRMFLSFVKSDKPSYLGEQFPEYMQYDDVMNTAHTILNGVPGSYQEMLNALRNQTTRFPWINSLIEKLESPNTSELVRNEFVMAMRKQYAKHYMVNWSEWRVNGKEGFTVNVISSDQSGIATVIYDSWYDNLANSSMVHLLDGSFVLDAAKRKAFVSRMPAVREEAIKGNMEPLNNWLQEIGIKLSPAALEALKNPGKARVFKDLKTTASLFDSKNGVFYNIVQRLSAGEKAGEDSLALNNPYINNSGMMQLASLEAQYRTNIFSNSFRNANNDQVYSYAMPSFLSDRVEMLMNNDVELENLSNDVFAKNSTFLAQLKNKESFLRRHFNVSYADGIVKTHSNADGVKIENMSPTEYMIYALGLHANSALGEPGAGRKIGHYLLPTFSDKKRKAIITTAKHDTKVIFNSFKKEIAGFGPETKAAIENIVDSEINRMIAFKGHPDPAYSAGYKYFYLLPSLNNIETVFDSDHVYIDSPENRTILYNEALAYVKQLVLRRYSQFKNAGIIEEVEGQRYDPKTKSNINGTHDILNYVDSRYLKDIVDMNINSINQQGLYVAADYVINNLIVNTNMYQLVLGDPAMYFKGDKKDTSIDAQIASTYDNIGKRLAMMIAPGHSIAESDSDTIKYAFFKDDEDVSRNYTEIEKILKAHNLDPKPYTEIEGTDAQEYTTLKEHLHVLNLMGRISKSQMEGILSRSSSETLTDEDLHVIFQPIKPVYSNVMFESDTNTSRVLYVKSSSFPLFKQLTKGHSIDNLREAMEQEGVDRVAYKTAVKVGSRSLVSAFDSNHDFKSVDELRSELSSKQQPYVSRKGFRIQQEVPYDPSKAEATKGTQETKLLFLDILDLDGFQYNGKEYSAKDLKAIYEDLHKTLYGLKSEKFYKRFYTKQGKLDIKQLKEMMVDEARSRGMSKYDIDSLETYINTNNEEAFLMPLHSHPLADKFESLLLSLIDKQIIKQKMPGKSYVLGSELGFRLIETSSDPSASYPGIVYVPGYDPSKGLRSQTEDGKPAQVIAPFKFRNRNGELEDVRKYVVDGKLDTNKIPKELLQIFGFRIPTQGHNSMSYIEIVGFLPPNAGDLLIAPKDFTKQMGSDFDIDKLFSYVYNTRAVIDEEALSALLSTFKDTKKVVFSAMLPETKKAFETLLEARREAISAKDISRLQEVDESLSELIYSSPALASLRDEIEAVKSTILRWERDDSTEIKATQNAILDIHFSVLKNKGVFPNIMSPLGFGDTDSLAREIVALRKERRSKGTNLAIANFRPSLISEEYYQDKYFNGIVGKAMTGIKSLDSTFNAAIQGKGMYFRTYTEDGVEMPDGISFEGKSLYDLSGVTSLDGKNKSYHIAGYQSAAVDNEKEQILGKLNSNPITAAAERAIAQVGWPAEYSALLTSQDIILEFVDVSRRLSDSTSSVAGDRKELAIIEITERWLKKLGDPNYIADKDTPVSRDEMREMIRNGGKQYPNYFKHQLDLFAKFIDATTKGEALGDIQRVINTDSAGLGKNFIEVISKAESVKSSVMYNRVVANSVNVLGKPITDEDGRVVGIDFNTINGYATQYGLLPASTIFNNLFPYNSPAVRRVYKELANTLGYTQRGKAISDKVKKDVWNASKSFIFSDESVWGADPNELRNNLLFSTGTVDQNGNRTITSKSLAVRVKEYSETVKGSKNIFLSKLSYDITPDLTTPDFIKYAATKGENYDETNTYQGLIDLLIDPESRELAADLIKYSYLTGGIQQAINFVRYIPTSYLEHVGLAGLVREVDYKSTDLFGDVPSLTMGSSRFVTQFIQHNPAMAPKITNKDIKEGIFASRFEERNGLPDIFTLPPIGNNIAAKLVMTYSTPEGSVQSYPKFIAIPDKTSNTKFRLYTLVPTKDAGSAYFAIDTLGGKYKITEYSNKELIGNSTIEANTAPYTDSVKANIGSRMVKAVVTNTEDSSYKSKFELFFLNEGDSFNIVDTLNTIKNISTNPYHVELATVYSKLLPLVNNTLKGIIENKAQRLGAYYHPGNTVGYANVLTISNNRDVSQQVFEKVFLHELSHALTIDILDRVLEGKVEGITDEQIKAANRLVKLHNHLIEGIESGKYEEYGLNKDVFKKFKEVNQRRKAGKASDEDLKFFKANKRYYSFINIYELIAEGMSNSETRTLLSSIPYSDGNFVSKIIDLIKRILKSINIQTGTAYAEAVDSIFSLMGVTETNEAKEPRMPIESKPKVGGRSYYEGDVTPDSNTIFVFGSNPQGRHGAGAAKVAVQKFGAIYGQGEGLQGNAYALPTKDLTVKENNSLKSIDEKTIIESIKKLYRVAEQNPTKQFKIAYRNTDKSSLNGYTGLEMIQMFKSAGNIPSNIIFSKEWVDTGLFNEGKDGEVYLKEGIKANAEQVEALNKLNNFIRDEGSTMMTLSGYAGTGKTTLMGYFLNQLDPSSIRVTATTHKAVSVIGKATGLEANTIHSLIGLKPSTAAKDFSFDNIVFGLEGSSKKIRELVRNGVRLIVIDEASMVDDTMFSQIKEFIAKTDGQIKVIFIGDSAQLPPVVTDTDELKSPSKISKVFTDLPTANLTTVERTANGNPLLGLFTDLRENLKSTNPHDYKSRITPDGRGYAYLNSYSAFYKQAVALYATARQLEDMDYVKVIAYSNAAVLKHNQAIRQMLYGNAPQLPLFSPGDFLLTYEALGDSEDLLPNSSDLTVVKVEKVEDGLGFKVYKVDTGDTVLSILDHQDAESVNKYKERYLELEKEYSYAKQSGNESATRVAFERFTAFRNSVIIATDIPIETITLRNGKTFDRKANKQIDYGYAITSHKAQGSTYKHVLIDEANIDGVASLRAQKGLGPEATNKSKYVAFSRASTAAYVYAGARGDTKNYYEGERSDFFLDEIDLETETTTEAAFVDPIIKQYQLRRQNILNAISKARTNKDIKRVAQLDKELKQLSKAITDLKTIELVDTALLQAEDELKAVGKALSTELSYSELNNLADIIYLWKDLREHLQDYMNFKKDSPLYKTISERIDNIEKEAFSLAKIHMKMAKQVINKAVRSVSTREVGNVTDPKEDIGYWRGNFLDISRSQDPLLQAVDKICTQVAYDQTDEYREFQAELEEVFKDFYKSRYYQDGKFTKFLQVDDKGNKTGRLVSPYSHDYYKLYGHYKGRVIADPSDIKAYANYMRFLRKNVIMFDVRALFYSMYKAHGGTEAFTADDIKAREDYLKDVLGETRYNIELERQRERLSKWEMDLAGYKLSIEDSEELSDLEKNAAIESFIRLRSPFEFMKVYMDPSLDVSVKESITGDRYLIGIPRKTVNGKETGFYDSSYLEIERDPILLHTYESIVTLMNRYVGYLPEHLTYDIRPNFLPILTKSESGVLHGTLDNYATYGMKAVPAGLRDAWVDAVTQNIGGDYTRNTIDPVTGKERPDFTFNFLSKNPDLDPLPEDRSYDIPMLIDKFAKQAIFYKHRSRVQDMLYLANTVSSELKESTITPKGNPMINWITRKLHVTTGLDNNRQALEYYISAFHGNKREIEGATKKKMLTAADKRKQMALIAELELVEERLARHSTVGLMKRKAQLEKAIDEIGKNFTWGRLGDTILQYSQIRGMGWNPVSAANNITWGLLSNLIHAAGEQDYTMTTFRKAYAKMLNVVTPGKLRELGPEMFKEATKLHNLVYQFDVIKEINEAEYSSMVDNSRVLKGISKEFNPFEMHRKGEYLNQGVNLIAILMTEKITDVKGNERSFYDAFNTDGSWNTEEFGERPTERINALRMKTDQLNKRIHGNYDPNSPLRFKRMFIGRAIMQFRSWIPEAYQTRFEATNYDERLGREVKGRYRSFGAYFDSSTPYYKSIGKATGALAVEMANIATLRKITALNKYGAETAGESIDVANMRMNAMDGLILSALLVAFKILKSMWDADDDDKKKNKIMLAMNIINRLENDAMFFYNPLAIESIVQSTIPATKLLVDVSKLLDALYDDIVLDEDYILTGPAAGKAKVPYRVGKLVPGIAGYLRYEGSQEKMDN